MILVWSYASIQKLRARVGHLQALVGWPISTALIPWPFNRCHWIKPAWKSQFTLKGEAGQQPELGV